MMKECRRCGVLKDEGEFYFDNLAAVSRTICKACDKEYAEEYYSKNCIEYRSKAREFYLEKKTQKLKASKEWFDNNPEKLKTYNSNYQKSELYKKQVKLSYLRLKMKKIGVSFKEFVARIESYLPETESWDNYKKSWEVVKNGDGFSLSDYKVKFY